MQISRDCRRSWKEQKIESLSSVDVSTKRCRRITRGSKPFRQLSTRGFLAFARSPILPLPPARRRRRRCSLILANLRRPRLRRSPDRSPMMSARVYRLGEFFWFGFSFASGFVVAAPTGLQLTRPETYFSHDVRRRLAV